MIEEDNRQDETEEQAAQQDNANEGLTHGRVPKTDDELKSLASAVYHGQVFTDRSIHPQDAYLVGSIFMALPFINGADLEEIKRNAGLLYEDMSKAGPRSINGYPMFFSLQWLDKDETSRLFAYYEQYKSLQQSWNQGDKSHEKPPQPDESTPSR